MFILAIICDKLTAVVCAVGRKVLFRFIYIHTCIFCGQRRSH